VKDRRSPRPWAWGVVTLPTPARRKAKLNEGDLLEILVEEDGSIRLIPKLPIDRALAEKYQLADVTWALKQKGKKK
jgi:AbrB family looped-hinge helix DNA binding protein